MRYEGDLRVRLQRSRGHIQQQRTVRGSEHTDTELPSMPAHRVQRRPVQVWHAQVRLVHAEPIVRCLHQPAIVVARSLDLERRQPLRGIGVHHAHEVRPPSADPHSSHRLEHALEPRPRVGAVRVNHHLADGTIYEPVTQERLLQPGDDLRLCRCGTGWHDLSLSAARLPSLLVPQAMLLTSLELLSASAETGSAQRDLHMMCRAPARSYR